MKSELERFLPGGGIVPEIFHDPFLVRFVGQLPEAVCECPVCGPHFGGTEIPFQRLLVHPLCEQGKDLGKVVSVIRIDHFRDERLGQFGDYRGDSLLVAR